MKKITTMLMLVLSIVTVKAQHNKSELTEGIQFFTGTWLQALDIAKKENKFVFLDAYASWCGPCKLMKRNTFTDAKVAEFYNKHFINMAIDMEKGEGVALSEKYDITSYPTLLFIKPDGKIVLKATGYHKVEDFISVGKNVLK
jgi:thioredoxin 1